MRLIALLVEHVLEHALSRKVESLVHDRLVLKKPIYLKSPVVVSITRASHFCEQKKYHSILHTIFSHTRCKQQKSRSRYLGRASSVHTSVFAPELCAVAAFGFVHCSSSKGAVLGAHMSVRNCIGKSVCTVLLPSKAN